MFICRDQKATERLIDPAVVNHVTDKLSITSSLVPVALRAVRKGGRVVCAGIHMSDIPAFPYRLLWEERQIVSVANLTRADGEAFLSVAPRAGIKTHTTVYPLREANAAVAALRSGALVGAAALRP